MTDTTTFGHMMIGFLRTLRRQKAMAARESEAEYTQPEKVFPKRQKRQATKPSLAKRQSRRKARNRMARQSRRINRR